MAKKWILSLGIVLCGIIIIPYTHDKALMPRHILWCIVTIILALCTRDIHIGKVHYFALGYLFFVALSGIFAINKSEWLYWFLRAVLVVSYLSVAEVDTKLLTKFMLILGMIFIGYFWYDYLIVKKSFSHCRGLMLQRNSWAAAQFLVIPFCYYANKEKLWSKLALIIMLMMAVNIILLFSKSAMLALFVSGLIVLRNKYVVLATAVCIVLALFFFGDRIARHDSVYTRLIQWKPTMRMIGDHPMGVGAGNWWILFPNYAPDIDYAGAYKQNTFRFPHNDYVWIWSETGLGGIICYLGMFGYAIYCAHRKKAVHLLVGLCGFMTIAFFTPPRERAYLTLMATTFIVMACPRKPIPQPRILLASLIFAMVVFGFRAKASYYNRKLVYASSPQEQRIYARKGYSVFSTLMYSGQPWYWWMAITNIDGNRLTVEYFEKAYKHNPYNIFVLNGMGIANQLLHDKKQARIYFDKALEICPRFEVAKLNAGKG